MQFLTKLALGAFTLKAAGAARINAKRDKTRVIGGVPVHNYHFAFARSKWSETAPEVAAELAEDEELWILMMRPGISEAELDAICAARSPCVHGHSGGVPFLQVRATEKELEQFLANEKGMVEFVEPDMPALAIPEVPSEGPVAQSEVPWGLRRVRARSLDTMPKGDPGKADGGKGVHVYVMDTGIRTTHSDFGGRATSAMELGWFSSVRACNGDPTCALDKQGHGTHCAGTVGGQSYGVAKGAQIYAVKVLNDRGSGSTGGIINGMNWVAANAQKPAVASMSLGGGASTALTSAVGSLTDSGVVVVTASGNNNDDSCNSSPGNAPSAINVGSTDPSDEKSSFSNYGECLAIWAPGRDVLSAGITSDTDSRSISGTSMACPHVAGGAAILLQAAPTLTPAQVKAQLVQEATPDVVLAVPGYPPTPNLFLYTAE